MKADTQVTQINDKSTVPLYSALGAFAISLSMLGGGIPWIISISTKAEVASAKNIEQDVELKKRAERDDQVIDRLARIETLLQVLAQKK